MFDLSIVIPVCNRAALLEETISIMQAGTTCRWELIVVDGASTDGTPAYLSNLKVSLGDRLQVIRETQREGFTKAMNKGFRAARGEYLTWLNDDARPVGHSLDKALQQARNSPADVGLLAMFHTCQTPRNIAYTTIRNGREYKLLHVRGTLYANFAFGRRQVFDQLGFFDERYYVQACDPDFSLKVWHAGLRIVPAFNSLIDHEETADDRRAADSPRAKEDNEKLFARWNLPPKNMAFNDFDPTHPCTLKGLLIP